LFEALGPALALEMSAAVLQRSVTPPPRERLSSGGRPSLTTPSHRFPVDPRFASPASNFKQRAEDDGVPFGFQTPGLKGKSRQWWDDECSTVAPSSRIGLSSPSPWPTPNFRSESPCVVGRQRAHTSTDWQPVCDDFDPPPSFSSGMFDDFAVLGLDGYDSASALPLEIPVLATPAPARCRGCPGAPGKLPPPPLLHALTRHSLDDARAALQGDGDAARFPFWDHGVEPPLCAAVRLGCPASMLALLLEHGADAKAMDVKGRTALDVAKASKRGVGADIRALLVDAGVVETAQAAAPAAQTNADALFKEMTWAEVEASYPFSEECLRTVPVM